jgi:ATP-dependent Zn protease
VTDREVAFHEAAHAVAALLLGLPVATVSVKAREHSLGHVMLGTALNRVEILDAIQMFLAGGAAARKLTGRAALGDEDDLQQARAFAGAMAGRARAAELVDDARALVDALVIEHWDSIQRVAAALLTHGNLRGDKVADLL